MYNAEQPIFYPIQISGIYPNAIKKDGFILGYIF
jgi:hypothetical protein